uniref:Phospholipid phosphatase-related protein type 1 n=1 Tax=Sphenodon punctatus TaxID=8508 RepID=A0A8D0H6S2_SPHPU
MRGYSRHPSVKSRARGSWHEARGVGGAAGTPPLLSPPRLLVIMAGTVVLAYHFEYTDTFPVHVQGFFCYDYAFAKPYPGPEDAGRMPPVLVYSLVTAVPTVTILLGELAAFFFQTQGQEEKTIISGECCYFNPLLRRIVRFLGVYSFGLFTTTIFANAGQVVTGNPTPHFLSVCRPNYTALGCHPPPGTRYITDRAACAGNPALVTAARRAFPSKDAALSAYAVAYTVMYVTLVFRLQGSRLAKPTLCLALLCPAFLVGVVRVAEYRNHWSDVLAGFFTGGAIAAFLVTAPQSPSPQCDPPPPLARTQMANQEQFANSVCHFSPVCPPPASCPTPLPSWGGGSRLEGEGAPGRAGVLRPSHAGSGEAAGSFASPDRPRQRAPL